MVLLLKGDSDCVQVQTMCNKPWSSLMCLQENARPQPTLKVLVEAQETRDQKLQTGVTTCRNHIAWRRLRTHQHHIANMNPWMPKGTTGSEASPP
jgi:hypothetical protein